MQDDQKLDDLEERIRQARTEALDHAGKTEITPPDSVAAMRGARAGSAFLGSVIGGAVLGYVIDYISGTTPWGMILLMLAGFTAGVYSADKIMKNSSKK